MRTKSKEKFLVSAEIDYDKLVKTYKTKGLWSRLKIGSIGTLSGIPLLPKMILKSMAKEYGVNIAWSELERKEAQIRITVLISSIEYHKLTRAIIDFGVKQEKSSTNKLLEAAIIVEPFIDKTMETIPRAAAVKLFELLAFDKVIKKAAKSGITISNASISVKSD